MGWRMLGGKQIRWEGKRKEGRKDKERERDKDEGDIIEKGVNKEELGGGKKEGEGGRRWESKMEGMTAEKREGWRVGREGGKGEIMGRRKREAKEVGGN